MLLAVLVALPGNIKLIASLTDIGIFIVYFFVNVSLIWLRFRRPKEKRAFRSPINIGKFPVLALLGALSTFFMLFYFDYTIVLMELGVIVIGFLVYTLLEKKILKR